MPPGIDRLQSVHSIHRIIAAEDYNRVRLALSRLGNPLYLDLGATLPCLEVQLCDDYWLCFDSCRDEQPVLAWTAFERAGRSGLHEPVACDLHFYHLHAGLVMGDIFDSIVIELRRQLDQLPG